MMIDEVFQSFTEQQDQTFTDTNSPDVPDVSLCPRQVNLFGFLAEEK